MSEQTTNHEFRAETRKVLNILTHSLYSNREIFLRELISNASDALDKLRFLQSQTQHEAIRDAELPLEIRISSDKVQNCLTITDTGIGMTRDEMIENLGTIAHSGSEAFLKEHTQTAEDGTTSDASNIIGRFGIGFYSVFMVADKVEVTSLSATGDGPAYRWISDGTGTFTVEEAPDQADIKRGTTIRAFIKEGDKEFLEKYRIEGIIRTHSSFIPFPILVDGERVNTTPALWREPKFSIKKEQYDEFYKFLTYDQKDPLDVLHLSVDAPVQFNALLFIPDITKDYFGAYREHWGLDLYARRVLIQRENKELIPDYLAFLKGVVDTEDLPLNISREMLQDNSLVRKISDIITKRFIKHLEKLAKDDQETYREFYAQFSRYLKEGVVTSWPNKESLGKLLRFESTATEPGETTSFEDYVTRMKEGQTAIYALTGPSRSHLENSPYLEAFKARGYEVAFFTDHGDEFVLDSLSSVDGKPVTMIDRADVELPALEEEQKDALPQEEAAALEEWLKGLYPDKFSKVTLGKRLVSGAAVALQSGNDMGPEMRAYMKAMGQEVPESHPQLELNPSNPLVKKLSALRTENPELAQMVADQIANTALLRAGMLDDPAVLAHSSQALMEQLLLK